jgi:Protein of unknown function (DUF3999)
MIRSTALALTLLLAAAHGARSADIAEPALQDFAWSAPIVVEDGDALYAADLPLGVYAGSARQGLADLRVFNGRGENVPYALRSVARPDPRGPEGIPVPIFPVWAILGTEIGGVSVRIRQGARGTIIDVQSGNEPGSGKGGAAKHLVGYLVDTSAVEDRLQALAFEWKESGDAFVRPVRIEASDDLEHWTRIASGTLMALRHAGHDLAQKRIGLRGAKAKYLRVSWPAAQEMPQLASVRAEPVDSPVEPPRAWHTVAASPGGKPGEYQFDLGASAPFDRLRVELPNPNTVAPVQFFARARSDDAWRLVASDTVYRLTQAGQAIASPDTAIRPTRERFWMVRVDTRSGGFGAGEPKLTAGYVPQQVLFVARGAGPFVLAFGSTRVASAALPVVTLVPGYREDKPLEAARATVSEVRAQVRTPSAWPEWLDLEPGDWKKLALWTILVVGVALLGWMAWRLGARVGKPAGDPAGSDGETPR